MAFTINGFWGAETGGMEEVNSFTATTADSAVKKGSGAYSYKNESTTASCNLSPFANIASAGTGMVVGFWYRTPSSFTDFTLPCRVQGVTSGVDFDILNWTDGTLILRDSTFANRIVSSALSTSTWYFIEAYVERVDSGAAELFVDGVSQGTTSGRDFNAATGTILFTFDAQDCALAWYMDSIYVGSGASSSADRLGGSDVISYRSNLNSVTPDTGSNLNAGTWLGAQAVPFSDAAVATYSSSAVSGSVLTNDVGGSAGTGGPNTDANITGTIKAAKGSWRALRGTGGATNHYGLLGNSVDGTTRSAALALTTGYTYREFVSEVATIVPTSSEYGKIGFETDGAQDITVADMLFQILHVPSVAPPGPSTGAGWWGSTGMGSQW